MKGRFMQTTSWLWLATLAFAMTSVAIAHGQAETKPDSTKRRIVLIAGPKSHGPVGNGMHDYGWSVCLLRVMLEHSNIAARIAVDHFLEGWPKNSAAVEHADTLMIVSDGRDGDKFSEALHLESNERVREVDRLMKRGCGLITFHFSTFAPEKYADKVLDWSGGYFQWETNGRKQWYSNLKIVEADVNIVAPSHPVCRGVEPFKMREEFYFDIKFRDHDSALTPLWAVPALMGRQPDGNVVAWVRERTGGGRSFSTTCGHFYDNWEHPQFRALSLNALAWTAHVEVPSAGISARYYTHEEIRMALGDKQVPAMPSQSNAAKRE
jgi:type 1 glutamine amidotransferase